MGERNVSMLLLFVLFSFHFSPMSWFSVKSRVAVWGKLGNSAAGVFKAWGGYHSGSRGRETFTIESRRKKVPEGEHLFPPYRPFAWTAQAKPSGSPPTSIWPVTANDFKSTSDVIIGPTGDEGAIASGSIRIPAAPCPIFTRLNSRREPRRRSQGRPRPGMKSVPTCHPE